MPLVNTSHEEEELNLLISHADAPCQYCIIISESPFRRISTTFMGCVFPVQREFVLPRSVVSSTSDEYEAVTRYFQATLGEKAEIHDLNRINVPKFRERFLTDGDHTIMFHGCRSSQNEASILEKGFRVASCVSGGTKFGTWFAYRADYSNRGYSFQDQDGLEHLFVCVVSYFYTVMDQALMRVVGQDCAYPQWLIRYRTARTPAYVPPVYAPPVVAGTSRPGKSTNRGRDRTWYVVRDGQWQLEGT